MFKRTKTKEIVGLAVTSNLGLEACVYDLTARKVKQYGQKFIEYNIASKEIQDIEAFKNAVSDLFYEMDIEKDRTLCYCVMPNVNTGFFGFDEGTVDAEAIDNAVLSQISQSYIFRDEEPLYNWTITNDDGSATSKVYMYSAIQKRMAEAIQDVMLDEEINFMGIETAATAIPRGVYLTGACNDIIAKEGNWNILTINPNGYSLTQMRGSKLMSYAENPFAIMSFDGDDIYPALASALGQYLPNYPAERLVIVSMTNSVSAARLSDEVVFDNDILSFDCNKFSETPIVPLDTNVKGVSVSSMSLSALGASVPGLKDFTSLNFLGDISYDGLIDYGSFEFAGHTFLANSETVPKWMMISSSVIIVLGLLIMGALVSLSFVIDKQTEIVKKNIEVTNSEIKELEIKLRDAVSNLIVQITDNNQKAMKYYDSLATDIPADVWLTYYTNKDGKDLGIEGYSTNINAIYDYYKSLKFLIASSGIKLNKLEVMSDDEKEEKDESGKKDTKKADDLVLKEDSKKPRTFYFEISNASYTKGFDDSGNPKEAKTSLSNGNNGGASGDQTGGEAGKSDAKDKKPAPSNENKPAAQDKPSNQPSSDLDDAQMMKREPNSGKVPSVPDIEVNLKEIN